MTPIQSKLLIGFMSGVAGLIGGLWVAIISLACK